MLKGYRVRIRRCDTGWKRQKVSLLGILTCSQPCRAKYIMKLLNTASKKSKYIEKLRQFHEVLDLKKVMKIMIMLTP